MYKFYGADRDLSDIRGKDILPGITPFELYDILSRIWCRYTCAPRLRDIWSEDDRTVGQCSITAFLAQDIFGGEVRGIPREGGSFHCFNVVDGKVFDLTSEQFHGEELVYEGCPIQQRDVHFVKTEKRERYDHLKDMLIKSTEER